MTHFDSRVLVCGMHAVYHVDTVRAIVNVTVESSFMKPRM
jgi:hypothetical protein